MPPVLTPDASPARNHQSRESQEEFDALFDSTAEEQAPPPKEEAPPPLSDNDLAVFDPCYKQGESTLHRTHDRPQHLHLFTVHPAAVPVQVDT